MVPHAQVNSISENVVVRPFPSHASKCDSGVSRRGRRRQASFARGARMEATSVAAKELAVRIVGPQLNTLRDAAFIDLFGLGA
jgi:hypothetical protein